MTKAETTTADDFARAFARAWTAQDAKALADLMAEDGDLVSLTGRWAEGRKDIATTFAAEFAGTLARARLVTGRAKLRQLGPQIAVLHQRFVLSGLIDPQGADLGRVGVVLVATLIITPQGWRAAALQFCAAEG
ncbi:hypothetical protein GCM10007291_05100 [Gemmobacter nanjingensis]|uniref:DUF4440 domain-containing protein n=1 Tax=Gemmobacter nanjingensis TaxID=488454 RepID=A0ABQ3F7A8_9RHOB|nr:SgcJ/EcaC family oxidoreductase [Gemmobacter nanjingensis]GHC11384.1 hypothetical protein GCM10007291_05100 [Gemmobacter nanjingensis]